MNPEARVCVTGAGPSGVAAGLDVLVFEKNDKVGGNWVFHASISHASHTSVYENTHTISAQTRSENEDIPLHAGYPELYVTGPYQRHTVEVDKLRFRSELRVELRCAGIGKPPLGTVSRYKLALVV